MALSAGRIALGEAKPRALGQADLERMLRIRELLRAPKATVVLASASGVTLPAGAPPELVPIGPAEVYG